MVLVRSQCLPLNVSAALTLTIAVSWAADGFRLWYQGCGLHCWSCHTGGTCLFLETIWPAAKSVASRCCRLPAPALVMSWRCWSIAGVSTESAAVVSTLATSTAICHSPPWRFHFASVTLLCCIGYQSGCTGTRASQNALLRITMGLQRRLLLALAGRTGTSAST